MKTKLQARITSVVYIYCKGRSCYVNFYVWGGTGSDFDKAKKEWNNDDD